MFKLFVGGFPPETSALELKSFFSRFGKIAGFTIIFDKKTKASKGYGFLACEAKKTQEHIFGLKMVQFNGRTIEINKAVDKSNDVPSDIQTKALRKLFIGGLSPTTDSDSLYNYFHQYGELITAYVILDPDTKASRNFGYVEFASVDGADAALSESPHTLHSRKITVERKKGEKNQTKLPNKTNIPSKIKEKKEKKSSKVSAPNCVKQNKEFKVKDSIGPNLKQTDPTASDGFHSDTHDSFQNHGIKEVDVGIGKQRDPSFFEDYNQVKRTKQSCEEIPLHKTSGSSSKFMGNWTQNFYEYLQVLHKSESWHSHIADTSNISFNKQHRSRVHRMNHFPSGFAIGWSRAIGS